MMTKKMRQVSLVEMVEQKLKVEAMSKWVMDDTCYMAFGSRNRYGPRGDYKGVDQHC